MGIIWHKTVNGKLYEVRSAGETRRLYTDGVFHSQFNPNRVLTTNVWDLISLPSFFLDGQDIRRILVLGVGGGAVIRQFLRWYPGAEITGVELDEIHISIGKRFFGLSVSGVKLLMANAIDWVKSYRGLPFDIVIDDLFGETDGEPVRVIKPDRNWMEQLSTLLTPHGMLIMNFTESRDLRNNAVFTDQRLRSRFKSAYRLMTPLYDNQVGVFLKKSATTNQWRNQIRQHEIGNAFEKVVDKYQIRKLKLE